jgi:hypothetical protein
MEACDRKPIRGQTQNVRAVLEAIEKAGVELTVDGVRYLKPPKRAKSYRSPDAQSEKEGLPLA